MTETNTMTTQDLVDAAREAEDKAEKLAVWADEQRKTARVKHGALDPHWAAWDAEAASAERWAADAAKEAKTAWEKVKQASRLEIEVPEEQILAWMLDQGMLPHGDEDSWLIPEIRLQPGVALTIVLKAREGESP